MSGLGLGAQKVITGFVEGREPAPGIQNTGSARRIGVNHRDVSWARAPAVRLPLTCCVSPGKLLNLSLLFLHLQNGTSSNTCLTGVLENFHNTDTASNGAWQVVTVQAVAHFRVFIRETLVGLLLSGR